MAKHQVTISGVPETLLWTLHNRANEAKRPNGFIKDDLAVELYEKIEYDYERSFGKPDGSHAWRSKAFDAEVNKWLSANPAGPVIELGAGLETQFFRIDNDQVNWYAVDVAESIDLREELLPKNTRLKNIAKSALDFTWINKIPKNAKTAFVTFQGLLMYFTERDVINLLQKIEQHFDSVYLMFDIVPGWMSKKTMNGYKKTRHYTLPKMPWGIGRHELRKNLQHWLPSFRSMQQIKYQLRGFIGFLFKVMTNIVPWLNNNSPQMILVKCEK